jgi:hypothetical protein
VTGTVDAQAVEQVRKTETRLRNRHASVVILVEPDAARVRPNAIPGVSRPRRRSGCR